MGLLKLSSIARSDLQRESNKPVLLLWPRSFWGAAAVVQPSSGTSRALMVWAVPGGKPQHWCWRQGRPPWRVPSYCPSSAARLQLDHLISDLSICAVLVLASWMAYTAKGWEGSARNCNKQSCLMFSWIGCWIDLLIFNFMVVLSVFINLQKNQFLELKYLKLNSCLQCTFFFLPKLFGYL